MPRISVNDAAVRFDCSQDTILRRIKLHQLVGSKDNRGKWWVILPDDGTAEPADSAKMRNSEPSPRGPHSTAKKSEIIVLTEALSGMMERMEHQHQVAIQLLVERVDAAELRAERAEDAVRDMLEHQSRPWWQRWFLR